MTSKIMDPKPNPKTKTVKFHIVYANSIIGAKTHTLLVSSQSNLKESFRDVAKSFVNVNDTDNIHLYLGETIVLFQYDLLDEKVVYNLAIIPGKILYVIILLYIDFLIIFFCVKDI